MAAIDQAPCVCGDTPNIERVRYFPRQLLTADDMLAEQEYFRQRQRRFNRFVLGWGVVCGLEVKPDPDNPRDPFALLVCPGYALGPWGDEIYVDASVRFNLQRCFAASMDPCEPRTGAPLPTAGAVTKYLAIKYAECPSRPVRTTPYGCGCDETQCDYSRIRDGFALECLADLPSSHKAPLPLLCQNVREGKVLTCPPCPPCPKEPWLVLATLNIRRESSSGGTITKVDTPDCVKDRRFVFSAALVQRQILMSCNKLV
jgi:hypothetical protein